MKIQRREFLKSAAVLAAMTGVPAGSVRAAAMPHPLPPDISSSWVTVTPQSFDMCRFKCCLCSGLKYDRPGFTREKIMHSTAPSEKHTDNFALGKRRRDIVGQLRATPGLNSLASNATGRFPFVLPGAACANFLQ